MTIIDYLGPFSEIVQSEIANGPITSVALSSLLKFMQYGYLDISLGVISLEALEMVVVAAMKCKFEALDSETDSVVMFKILKVLQRVIQVDTALLLSDQLVYDMVQTCFKLSIQSRVSALLRKGAEMALIEIFQFASTGRDSPLKIKLSHLYIPHDVLAMVSPDDSDSSTSSSDSSETVRVNAQGVSFIKDTKAIPPTTSTPSTPSKPTNNAKRRGNTIYIPTAAPFGVSCLTKLLRFLCTIINPKDPSVMESMRLLGLTLLNSVIEILGYSIAENSRLMDVVSNDVCRYLLQSVRSETSLPLLSNTLRICYNLFSTLRSQLGFQLDLFLRSALAFFPEYEPEPTAFTVNLGARAPQGRPTSSSGGGVQTASSPSTLKLSTESMQTRRSFAQQELALDVLVQLCRDPSFPVDLLVTFDCDLSGPNLFEMLVMFLENISDSRYERIDTPPEHVKAFRSQAQSALAAMMSSMSSRYNQLKDHRIPAIYLDTEAEMVETPLGSALSAHSLLSRRSLKVTLKTGADHFNAKPKDGIKFLMENGILPDPLTAESVAKFFRSNPFVNKAAIGEYFGARQEFNQEVLKAYSLSFDWDSKGFFESFREFLESFRIPGESPVIEKIVDTWTKLYYHRYDVVEETPVEERGEAEDAPKTRVRNTHPVFRTLDACYVVAISIVLLNVDMYNPNVKSNRRMNMDQYVNNLRGQNGKGEHFPPEFLRGIYSGIRASEIRVAEEHMSSGTADIPQGTWQSMWSKQHSAQLSKSPQDALPLQRSLEIGKVYGIYDELMFNAIWQVSITMAKHIWQETHVSVMETLSQLSNTFYAIGNLAAHFNSSAAFDALITALTEASGILKTYKDYSFEVRFVQDKKAQAATSVLFTLAHQYANVIREGWKSINDIMIMLQAQATLPPILEEVADDSVFEFRSLPPPMSEQLAAAAAAAAAAAKSAASPLTSMFSSLWRWGSGAASAALSTSSSASSTPSASNSSSSSSSAYDYKQEDDDSSLPAELERYRNSAKQILIDCHLPDVIAACSRSEPDSLLFFMQVLILGSSSGPAKPIQASSPIMSAIVVTSSRSPSPSSSSSSLSTSAPTSTAIATTTSSGNGAEGSPSNPELGDSNSHQQPSSTPSIEDSSSSVALQQQQQQLTQSAGSRPSTPSVSDSTPATPISASTNNVQLIRAAQQPTINSQSHRRLAPKMGSKNRFEDSVALYCADMLAHLALLNAHRVSLIWPIISNHFVDIIRASERPTPLTERAITNMLVVVAKLLPAAIGVPSLVSSFDFLGQTAGHFAAQTQTSPNLDSSPSSSVSVATHMCKCVEVALCPSSLGEELSKAYSHKISHAMRVILRRNAKAIGAASSIEWQALLDAVCANMMDTSEHMENMMDVLSSSLVKGLIPTSLATSAQVFTSSSSEPSSKLDLVSLSSTLVSSHNIRAVHSSVLKLLTQPSASLDALVEGMDCAQALLILGPQKLSGTFSQDLWHGYLLNSFILPIFVVLAQLAHDHRVVVKQTALSQLQKAFCSTGLSSFASSEDWILLFQRIIFPLLDSMLSSQSNAGIANANSNAFASTSTSATTISSNNATREATEEAFMRALAVLSKTYLHCMAIITPTSLVDVWNQVLLRYAAFHKNLLSSEVVQESVVEAVKNTLSVMHSSKILLASLPDLPEHHEQQHDPQQQLQDHQQLKAKHQIWTQSWIVIDQFAPSLRKEFTARTGISPPPPPPTITNTDTNTSSTSPANATTTVATPSATDAQSTTSSSNITAPTATSAVVPTSASPMRSTSSAPHSPQSSSSRPHSPINPSGTVLEL